MKARKSYENGGRTYSKTKTNRAGTRTVTKIKDAEGNKSKTVIKEKKDAHKPHPIIERVRDGATVIRSRSKSKSKGQKTVTRSKAYRVPEKAYTRESVIATGGHPKYKDMVKTGNYTETTKSKTRSKSKVKSK